MHTPIEEKLITAKVGLLLRASFFGNLASRMRMIEASDWCSTAATDGRNFYYNTEFVEKLSNKNIEFLFAHEILHCAFDHFGRCGSRNRKLANIAQDFAVNQILVDDKIGDRITQVDICQDDKYRGMAWEEIYELLEQNMTTMTLEELLDMLGDQLDDHINEDQNGAGSEFDENAKEGRPKLSKEDLQNIRDELKEAMIQAASSAAGNVPAAIKRLIGSFTQPVISWRDVLQMNIQSIVRSNYSFSRPSRKGWASGAILPVMIPEQTIDIAIALDMSGSISDREVSIFLGEINGIVSQYADFKINLFTFDTQVYNSVDFTHDTVNELMEYEPKGGGGTCFDCIFEHLKEQGRVPKKLVVFSDCYTNTWGDPNYCDTLFIVFGNEGVAVPYGQAVHYTN